MSECCWPGSSRSEEHHQLTPCDHHHTAARRTGEKCERFKFEPETREPAAQNCQSRRSGEQWRLGGQRGRQSTAQPHHSHQRVGTSLLSHSSPALPNTQCLPPHRTPTVHSTIWGKDRLLERGRAEGRIIQQIWEKKKTTPKKHKPNNIFHSL